MRDQTTNEFWVHCRACAHEWIAAYVPMELSLFAKVVGGTRCPKCGGAPPKVFCGRKSLEAV